MNNELRECSYKNVGCDFRTSVLHEMRMHLKDDITKHLQVKYFFHLPNHLKFNLAA